MFAMPFFTCLLSHKKRKERLSNFLLMGMYTTESMKKIVKRKRNNLLTGEISRGKYVIEIDSFTYTFSTVE